MEISSAQLKELRNQTGISVMQCKKALEEAGGDMEKAMVFLKKKGAEVAEKKSNREFGAGVIGTYTHNTNEVAALVHLACETDFVAKNEKFVTLARDIAMHVTAMNPQYLTRNEIDEKAQEAAKAVFAAEVKDKPEELQDKILAGKLESYFQDSILMEQPFVKDPEKTIGDMVQEAVQAFGENISVLAVKRLSVK
jgi:elongation factor Ts